MIITIVTSTLGYGHVTRQIALMHALLEIDPTIEIRFVCDEYNLKPLMSDIKFSKNIKVYQIPFVPKFTIVNNKVDIEATIISYQRSWEFETQLRDDREWERILYGSDLLINDIESIHNTIAKKMGITILNLSNFTWSDLLEHIGAHELAESYVTAEKMADYNFKLPFSTPCKSFTKYKEVGLLSRNIDLYDPEFEDIRKKHETNKLVLITSNFVPEFDMDDLVNKLIKSDITPILQTKQKIDGALTFDNKIKNMQNLIAIVDAVIGKIGYSTTSECVSGGTAFIHFTRPNFLEDHYLSKSIIEMGYGTEVTQDTDKIIEKTLDFIDKPLPKQQNMNLEIAHDVIGLII